MAALAEATAAPRAATRWFYVWITGACALIAFLGFAPTYWLNLARGTIHAAPIMHIHGALFFAWTIFAFVQTSLIANGRGRDHRAWGMFGIALASAMVCAALLVTVYSLKHAAAIGMAAQGEAFAIVSFSSIPLFATLVTLAIMNVHRPEAHKRFMVLSTIALMQPAIARWFIYFLAPPAVPPLPPGPVAASILPGLMGDLLILVAIVHDWRTRGRPHPVNVAGGAAVVFVQLIRLPLADTPAWHAFARGLAALMG